MNVGTQVRALREQQGLSQAALAARTGVHQAHIANIESGAKKPSVKVLVALASALGVTINDLVTVTDAAEPIPQTA